MAQRSAGRQIEVINSGQETLGMFPYAFLMPFIQPQLVLQAGRNRIIGVVFSVVEVLLAFRLFFKLLGANPENGFVSAIYALTRPYAGIFSGIFNQYELGSNGTTRVFEPETLIALIVTAILASIIITLLSPRVAGRVEHNEVFQNEDVQNQGNNRPVNSGTNLPNNPHNPHNPHNSE